MLKKNLTLLSFLFSVILVCIGCNNSNPVKSEISKPTLEETLKNEKQALRARALNELKTMGFHPLPFVSEFGEGKNDRTIYNLLYQRKVTALDSLIAFRDINAHWYKGQEWNRKKYNSIRFITRLIPPSNDTELFLYIIQDKIEGLENYTPVYIVTFNKTTLEMINNVQIGFCSMNQDVESAIKGSAKIEIDKYYNIKTNGDLGDVKRRKPIYTKEYRVTINGEIIKENAVNYYCNYKDEYKYDGWGFKDNYTLKDRYILFEIEDSIRVSTDVLNPNDDPYGIHFGHLDIAFFNKENQEYDSLNSINDTLTIYDHVGRKWLDVINYKQFNEKSYLGGHHSNKCSDAHYIEYMYNSIEDSMIRTALEVDYYHIGLDSMPLRTRYNLNPEDLPYEDWRVINLLESVHSLGVEEYLKEHPGTSDIPDGPEIETWSNKFYFTDSITYTTTTVEGLKSLDEIKQDRLDAIYKVNVEVNALESALEGEYLSDIELEDLPSPELFLEGYQLKDSWRIIAKPISTNKHNYYKNNKRIKLSRLIIRDLETEEHLLVLHESNDLESKGKILDVKELPTNKKIYSAGDTLYTLHSSISGNQFSRIKTYWTKSQRLPSIKRISSRIKTVVFSGKNLTNILKVTEHEGILEFATPNAIVPKLKSEFAGRLLPRLKAFKDHKERSWVTIKAYDVYSGHYIMYNYKSGESKLPERVVEVRYHVTDSDEIELEFRSATKELDLNSKSFIKFISYPKGHKKYVEWNRDWYSASSAKELNKLMKNK